MFNLLQQHLVSRLGNAVAGLEEVMAQFKPLSFKRNEVVLREGEVCRHVYFVAKGCLQVFVMDAEGSETTRDIVTENSWCSELISFGSQKPATENIRAVEPTQLCAITYFGFQTMMQTVPAFDKVYKQILEASYANSVYRLNSFVSLSALDRIKWLMQHRPEFMTRLSSKLIASYLGINKDVFSRLKARL